MHTIRSALKRCSACKREKPRDAFSKNRSRTDGLHHQCKDCKAKRNAAYSAANKEKIAKRKAAYRVVNKEKIAKRRAAYRAANKEKIAAYRAAYNVANKEKRAAYKAANQHACNAREAKRRALKHNALDPTHSVEAERDLFDDARLAASFCGQPFAVDHIVPLSRGGKHHHTNLRVLPARLNSIKGNKLDSEVTNVEFHRWLSPAPVFEQVTFRSYRPGSRR